MTDREMLELAAKVGGIELCFNDRGVPGYWSKWRGLPQWNEWNPFEDDGDAFRLAVRLEIEIRVFNGSAHAGKQEKFWCTEHWFPGGNVFAATRRAIARAAAAIGSKI